jgi:hypothetical protein
MSVPPHLIGQLYEGWVSAGRPRCTHERYDRVQDMGAPPEEYVCMRCGLAWDIGDSVPPPRGGDDNTPV